jgi:hypothetical protein
MVGVDQAAAHADLGRNRMGAHGWPWSQPVRVTEI